MFRMAKRIGEPFYSLPKIMSRSSLVYVRHNNGVLCWKASAIIVSIMIASSPCRLGVFLIVLIWIAVSVDVKRITLVGN